MSVAVGETAFGLFVKLKTKSYVAFGFRSHILLSGS